MASSTLQTRVVLPTAFPGQFNCSTETSTTAIFPVPEWLWDRIKPIFSEPQTEWRDKYAANPDYKYSADPDYYAASPDVSKGIQLRECNNLGKLLNFDVLDTCFLSEEWYNGSEWMFALTCLIVASLVFTLEALRMVLRQYDEKLAQGASSETVGEVLERRRSRPSAAHQAVRALIYTAIVINAYVLILFAVSFNGFILLTILVASYFAFFFFTPLHTTTRAAVTP